MMGITPVQKHLAESLGFLYKLFNRLSLLILTQAIRNTNGPRQRAASNSDLPPSSLK